MTENHSPRHRALSWVSTAAAGFKDAAGYLRSIPEDGWNDPSGASRWTIRDLAGHIAGEAVWFPNLVRGVTQNEEPYPSSLYDELKRLPAIELTDRIESAAEELVPSVEAATDEQLEETVDLGFVTMPLWRATFVSAVEGVFHNWDTRAKREPNPRIPNAWALAIADPLTELAPVICHHTQVSRFPGTYLLDVRDGFGPVMVTARDGKLTVERGASERCDVTLQITADQYIRLVAGRLDLAALEQDVPMEGDRERVSGLTHIFGGIANED